MANYEIQFVRHRAAYDSIKVVSEDAGLYLQLPPHVPSSSEASVTFHSGRVALASAAELRHMGAAELGQRIDDFLRYTPHGADGTLSGPQIFTCSDPSNGSYPLQRLTAQAATFAERAKKQANIHDSLARYTQVEAIDAARGALLVGATMPIAAVQHEGRVHMPAAVERGEPTTGRAS